MRIAQANLSDEGGAFSFIFQVQKQLNGKEQFDYYSILPFKNKHIMEEIISMDGKIYDLSDKTRFLSNLLLPFRFYNAMRRGRYEVIHVHSDTAWKLSIYAIPAKLAGVSKVIVHSHSSGVNGDQQWIKLFFHKVMRFILPFFSDVMLGCSDKALLWMYPWFARKKANIIKNGVNIEQFRFDECKRNKYRKELGVKDNEVLIVSVCDFTYPKNPRYTIDVFEKLYKYNNSFRLLFLGTGRDRKKIEKYAGEMKSCEKIIFYGRTSNVSNILNAADIFIMPSRFEGLPVSAIEAQTNGLFCILSDRITKEIKMIDERGNSNCVFWDIEETPSNWAERIIKIKDYYIYNVDRRLLGMKISRNNGYDIVDIAKMIGKIYRLK